MIVQSSVESATACLDGVRRLRTRRAACSTCGATHVLEPASTVAPDRDSAEMIGAAWSAKVAGAGHRRIAAVLDHPASTVRGASQPRRSRPPPACPSGCSSRRSGVGGRGPFRQRRPGGATGLPRRRPRPIRPSDPSPASRSMSSSVRDPSRAARQAARTVVGLYCPCRFGSSGGSRRPAGRTTRAVLECVFRPLGRRPHAPRHLQPTEPSICSSIKRLHSTAYSIGRVRVIGSMNPLTIMLIACCSESPRLIR